MSRAELSRVHQYLRKGFPVKLSLWQITAYSKIAADFVDADGILLHNDRIIILLSMSESTLRLVHDRHLDVKKTKSFHARPCGGGRA